MFLGDIVGQFGRKTFTIDFISDPGEYIQKIVNELNNLNLLYIFIGMSTYETRANNLYNPRTKVFDV